MRVFDHDLMPKVTLNKHRDLSVRRRHPWIFSGAIARVEPVQPDPGSTVAVVSADGSVLGYGSYSPQSQIRVRMLSFSPDVIPDASFIKILVDRAVSLRSALLSGGWTDAVRLVNAENDGLPGVVADFYAGWAVCQFTSAGAEAWKTTVAEALMECAPACRGVSERLDVDARARDGLPTDPTFNVLLGEDPPKLIEIHEGTVRFFVDVRNGHKTGFYLDQREARSAVAELAKGMDILNCFCYTGGFGLAAAVSGARHVTQVDISADAIRLAGMNAEATMPRSELSRFSYVEADVFQFLRKCRDACESFDLIVLDPPKFAATKSQVMKAVRGYKDINLLAMKLLRPGGILATFSCSGAITSTLFDQVLSGAAVDAKREMQIVARSRQSSDHPVALSFPEGAYLKGVFLKCCS